MVCHDCCCGTARKHPETDHERQRAELLACAGDEVRVRQVDCLDECDRSNVVLVRDHSRTGPHRDTWLGGVLDEQTTDAVVAWLSAGAGSLPPELQALRFTGPHQQSQR